jgi:hypothetical protein
MAGALALLAAFDHVGAANRRAKPMSFTEWTVLRHNPIEKIASNLWTVEGFMPKGNQRRMTIARLNDGRLIVHNAIALDANEMAELEAFGKVAAIVVPNAFHRQDARIWKERYPAAKVYAPKKALKKVAQVVAVDGDYDAIPHDDQVRASHLDGLKGAEGVIQVRSDDGTTLVFNDALLNMQPMSGFGGFFMAPTGRPSVPRFMRWVMIKDKNALSSHLKQLADLTQLKRLIPGHGATIDKDAVVTLRSVIDELG